MEGFISHYERHASYSDMSPNYEQLKLHHLHFTKLHMRGDDRAWLPAFVSNTCKIDTSRENLKMPRQALREELEVFVVSLLPSLTKQKTGGDNHPRDRIIASCGVGY